MSFSLDHPYLTQQLIAYIGNKRALLGFLYRVFEELAAKTTSARKPPARKPSARKLGRVFIDPFAGSGAVSRLARLMGYRVLANDWESYAEVLNTCHLAVEKRDLEHLFAARGGIDQVLETLNDLPEPKESLTYIARYYAPKRTSKADYRRERLFYTRENALRIDAIRESIEQWYPDSNPRNPLDSDALEKAILLAQLIYQSATHTNTSGVFKACHKGFGGHGRDALKRIMGAIRLSRPVLIDACWRAEVFCLDASDFVAHHSGDICYLDPPYTIHQYGSNYHMLNTIALWDKPPVDQTLTASGGMKEKAGIRRDWIKTRSPYCYRDEALPAFENLLDKIDCRFIALSYNTEGIVPFEQLYESLTSHGRVELYTSDYLKYRGGRQSLLRENYNLELLLVVERGGHNGKGERLRMDRLLRQKQLRVLLKQSFYPDRIRRRFRCIDSSIHLNSHRFSMPFLYRFDLRARRDSPDNYIEQFLSSGDDELLVDLQSRLAPCVCLDKRDEIEIILEIIEPLTDERMRHQLIKRALWLLRKFAFRKYQSLFEEAFVRIQGFLEKHSLHNGCYEEELVSIETRAQKRFNG